MHNCLSVLMRFITQDLPALISSMSRKTCKCHQCSDGAPLPLTDIPSNFVQGAIRVGNGAVSVEGHASHEMKTSECHFCKDLQHSGLKVSYKSTSLCIGPMSYFFIFPITSDNVSTPPPAASHLRSFPFPFSELRR